MMAFPRVRTVPSNSSASHPASRPSSRAPPMVARSMSGTMVGLGLNGDAVDVSANASLLRSDDGSVVISASSPSSSL